MTHQNYKWKLENSEGKKIRVRDHDDNECTGVVQNITKLIGGLLLDVRVDDNSIDDIPHEAEMGNATICIDGAGVFISYSDAAEKEVLDLEVMG